MKKNYFLIILPMLLLTATLQAQTKVWDFSDWPDSAALTVDTTYDGLTQVPGGGSSFGVVEANSATWFSGTANEYNATKRWKAGGSSAIDPSDGVTFMPTRRYLTFPVDGPVSIKIWFRQSGNSIPRDLWVTDGSAEVTHYVGVLDDQTPHYIEANYLGSAGNLYILFAGNAYNLYKIEISSTLLGVNDVASRVSTNIYANGDRIFVSNVKTSSEIKIYSMLGALMKEVKTSEDMNFSFNTGLYIATIKTDEGQKSIKLLVQ